ncbi:hypothetical protein FHY55_16935 [Oceanicola sp. D3]|uniref:NnrU family protein n=1 Tax=Oceanicola sp. D3 TaxID=2587163 RepID=UPI0011236943|nr:NnrU family protein [Oceanicola sp. D3]QDC10815.1 hypothetical protein FHY55_16935 [Oceanicola sp. D3]
MTGWGEYALALAVFIASHFLPCLGGRRGVALDPAQPGFAVNSRHPLFLALVFWAGAHLFPNGDLAMALFFGSFTLMALLAIPAFDASAR